MKAVRIAMDRLLALGGSVPTSRRVSVGQVALHLLEHGSGPPLLLLHGGGGGGANWYRLFPGLSTTHRVIAPDLPGFGLSPDTALVPPLGRQAAHLLVGLLDALSLPRVSVLGTSFGGLAGLRLAQHFPARVEHLLLLDSAGLAAGLPWVVRFGTRSWVSWAVRPNERGNRRLLRTLLTSRRLDPVDEALLVSYLTAVARAHSHAPLLRRFAGWRGQREVLTTAELRALRVPVLLLWGEQDRFFPVAQARRAARYLAGERLHEFPDTGHSPNWECPSAVLVQVRRFLAEQHDPHGGSRTL